MNRGKHICNTLKQIRLDIARANGIEYAPRECHHEGDCAGSCPACESEMRYLEREIARRRSLGRVALVAGVSLGLMSFTASSCSRVEKSIKEIDHPLGEVEVLAGDVIYEDSSEFLLTEGEAPLASENCAVGPDSIFRSAERMPQFPGGETALMKYVKDNIQYPKNALKNDIQGRVIVQFVVDKTGKVGEVKVLRSVDEDLDREAIRVCKTLPDFTPATQEGKAVDVWYTMPVNFLLPSDNK